MSRFIAHALACATLFLVMASPALAHSALLSASPGPNDEVVGSPTEVVARFSQDLDMSRTSMSVSNSAGTVVAEGAELGNGPRELRLALPELPAGEYVVDYTTFSSEDGELHRGDYTFTILPAPSPSPKPSPTPTPSASASPSASAALTPSPSPTASPSTGPTSENDEGGAVVAILLALIVVGAFGIWLLRRRAA